MIKKNFIKIIFIFLLASCGYSPMLSTMDNKILNIEVVGHEGDKEINQVLRSKFKIHRNENEELIKISINSSYKKKDLSKIASDLLATLISNNDVIDIASVGQASTQSAQ